MSRKTPPSLWACDMALLLDALMVGVARFEPATSEFCFDGLRYGCRDRAWSLLVDVAGRRKLQEAIDAARLRRPLALHETEGAQP